MIRGFFVAAMVFGLAACEPIDDDGVARDVDGEIELDMMDDGTIVSKI